MILFKSVCIINLMMVFFGIDDFELVDFGLIVTVICVVLFDILVSV